MSELISKRRLEEALICGLCHGEKTDDCKNGLWDALRIVNALETVNAVKLPCKIGDTFFEVCVICGRIHERIVHGFNIRENGMFIVCDTKNFEKREIGKQVFSSREEAEKALEDWKNDK